MKLIIHTSMCCENFGIFYAVLFHYSWKNWPKTVAVHYGSKIRQQNNDRKTTCTSLIVQYPEARFWYLRPTDASCSEASEKCQSSFPLHCRRRL